MTTYALLDYDGYICKAYYAGLKENKQEKVLSDLVDSAVKRVKEYFNTDDVKIIKVISGHTFKKDIYPSYKLRRKKDEGLGEFRNLIKQKQAKELTCVKNLEADDVLILLQKHLNTINVNNVVFSDDKDLRYYAYRYCKLNEENEIQENDISELINIYAQMLAGDSEDDIKGIPRMGMKTAIKYLESNMVIDKDPLETVIKCYHDKNIDIDSCLRDLLLVIPTGSIYTEDESEELSINVSTLVLKNDFSDNLDLAVSRMIESQIKGLNKIVKGVYIETSN